jgi:hypothetical protein
MIIQHVHICNLNRSSIKLEELQVITTRDVLGGSQPISAIPECVCKLHFIYMLNAM